MEIDKNKRQTLDPVDAKNMGILQSVANLFDKQPITKPYAKKVSKVIARYQKIAVWYWRKHEPYQRFLRRYVVVNVGSEVTEGILENIDPNFLIINAGKQTQKDGTSQRYWIPIDKVTKIERRGK